MKPCYCINPSCQQPDHPHNNNAQTKYCLSCGSTLLLNNKYRVSRLLSDNSGFAVIYEAFDGFNSKMLKVLQEKWNSEPKAVELFKREYDVLLALTQHNITGIPEAEAYFQYQNREGKLFYCLVMEKVEGIDLEKWVKQDNKLHQKQALNWLREVTLILDKVHQQKWFHRDIKPPNIMKRNNGELVVIDFGTAREETQTYYQNLQGQRLTGIISAGYTPNEQQHGQAVLQSDFFALGRTFVHLLTGKHPLDLYDKRNDELKWQDKVENIDPIFLDFIDDLMKRLPHDRPDNTKVILERLDKIEKQLQQQKPVPKPQTPVIPNPPQKLVSTPQKPVPNINPTPPGSPVNLPPNSPIKPQKPKNLRLKNGLIAVGGILLLLAGYPSYILLRYGFSATNPLLLNRDSSEFIYKTFTGHSEQVLSLAYSPDGKYLASGSSDETIKIWEVEIGQEVQSFSGDYYQAGTAIAYSPDGNYIASQYGLNTIGIWEVATGQLNRNFTSLTFPSRYAIYSIAYSPDGKYLVTESNDHTIKIWDVETGEAVRTLTGHVGTIFSITYSPDGKYLATGGDDKTIRIWDVETGEEVDTLSGHSNRVDSITYSPDGKYLASASDDQTIRTWDIEKGIMVQIFPLWADSIAYSPDGSYLAVSESGFSRFISIFEIAKGKKIRTFTDLQPDRIVYSPDGKYLAGGNSDGTITIWRVGR